MRCSSASSGFLLESGPLAFYRAVFLAPPVLFSILGFFYSTFWIFEHPGWEVPGVVGLSLNGLHV